MNTNTSDNSHTPPKPSIEELSRDSSCSTARVVLSFLATPVFLYHLISPFFVVSSIDPRMIWIAVAVFTTAYIGMIYRKTWAYFLCAIYAGCLITQPFMMSSLPESLNGEGPPFEGLFVLGEVVFFGAFLIYAAAILILSVVCGLAAWQSRKKYFVSNKFDR